MEDFAVVVKNQACFKDLRGTFFSRLFFSGCEKLNHWCPMNIRGIFFPRFFFFSLLKKKSTHVLEHAWNNFDVFSWFRYFPRMFSGHAWKLITHHYWRSFFCNFEGLVTVTFWFNISSANLIRSDFLFEVAVSSLDCIFSLSWISRPGDSRISNA